MRHLPLCNLFNVTRHKYLPDIFGLIPFYLFLILDIQDFIPQFDKLIQHNVNGNISKLAASVSFSSFRCFVILAV